MSVLKVFYAESLEAVSSYLSRFAIYMLNSCQYQFNEEFIEKITAKMILMLLKKALP